MRNGMAAWEEKMVMMSARGAIDINVWLKENEALLASIAGTSGITFMTQDEIVQDFRISCWHAAEKFDGSFGIRFSTYAFKAMKNRIKELYRFHATQQREFERTAESFDGESRDGVLKAETAKTEESYTLDEQLDGLEVRDAIKSVLSTRTERNQRIIVGLLNGYSQAMLAKKHHISQPCVSGMYQEFKSELRNELEKYC